jgi:uncharacterized protein YbjT (DUF2867 family)
MILVTGASGNVGKAALAQLLALGAPVRALYRSQAEAAKAPAGADIAIADFSDRAALDQALDDVKQVYLVCAAIPQLVQLESAVIDACRDHSVSHLVLNSAYGAGQWPKSFPSWHSQVEEHLRASGIPHTILRPETFMQNMITYYAASIRSSRAFYAAGRDAPLAFIDIRDIAAVIAQCLTQPGHEGATYTLTGSEALTYAQVAERISHIVGTPIAYVDLPPEQIRQSLLGFGMPAWQVDAILDLQAFYTEGPGATITGDVHKILGRDPILFDQFLHDNAASFKP